MAVPVPRSRQASRPLGTDELNLAEFPIALLAERPAKRQTTIRHSDTIFDEGAGRRVERVVTVTGHAELGLPTATDADVLVVLLHLAAKKGRPARKVEFHVAEALELLGWHNGGDYYARLKKSLRRWMGVTVTWDSAWWDRPAKAWRTEMFHVLDHVSLASRRGEASSVTLNEAILRSIQAGWAKPLDLDLYFGLKSPISRRLYRYLDKKFYNREVLSIELRKLAWEHVGLSRDYHNGEIKRRLLRATRELIEVGYLADLGYRELNKGFVRKARGEWQAVFRRNDDPRLAPDDQDARSRDDAQFAEEAAQRGAAAPAPPVRPTSDAGTADPLADALRERGVGARVATDLVDRFSVELIRTRIEVHDWLVESKDRRVRENPAGYLVASIRDGYQPPPDFKPAAVRQAEAGERQQAQQAADQAQQRREQEEAAARRAAEAPVEAYLAQLDERQRKELDAAAIVEADAFLRERFKSSQNGRFREAILKSAVSQHVRKILGLSEVGILPG